jgi:hypothetical protein
VRCLTAAPRARCRTAEPPARTARSASRSGQPAAEPDRAAPPPGPASARPAAGQSRGTTPADPAATAAPRTGRRAGPGRDGEVGAAQRPRRDACWPGWARQEHLAHPLGHRDPRNGPAERGPRKAVAAWARRPAGAAGSPPSGPRDWVTAAARAGGGTPPPAGGSASPRLRPRRRRWAASSTRTNRPRPPLPTRWPSRPAWPCAGRRSSRAPRRAPPLRRAPPACHGPSGAPGHAGRRSHAPPHDSAFTFARLGGAQGGAFPRAAQRLRRVAQSRRRCASYLAHGASSWFVRWSGSAPRTIRRSTGSRAATSRSAPCELGW